MDNMQSAFRCIIPSQALLMDLCAALKATSAKNIKNVDDFLQEFELHNPFLASENAVTAPKKGFVALLNEAEWKAVHKSIKEK
jgi:hypothetical protein